MKTKIPAHRIEGAFLGLALGDAYGRTLEFVNGEAVQQNAVLIDVNSFMWSEETHISIYIADAVLQMPQSKFEADQFGHLLGTYLSMWLDDPLMPSTNPGNTTLAGVRNYKEIKDWRQSGVQSGDGSAAITRICPIALAYDGNVLDEAAQIAAQITHGHPNALASALATARLLRIALTQGSLTHDHIAQVALEVKENFSDVPDVIASLEAAIWQSQRQDLDWLDDADMPLTDGGWRSPSTLGLALTATLKWGDNVALAIEKAARINGDSDAVAALTGMFLGAIHGVTQLPSAWLSALPQREDIRHKAKKLHNAVSQELVSIADQIRQLHTHGANLSTANLQTNTLQISVYNTDTAGITALQILAHSLGGKLETNDNTTSMSIDRTLVPNDVRKAVSMYVPNPTSLPPSKPTVPAPTTMASSSSSSTNSNVRTSESHPIGIDWVKQEVGLGNGALGITFAPGKKARSMFGKPWDRTLTMDLDRMKAVFQVDALVSLVEDFELTKLSIPDLVAECQRRRIAIYRSPIQDGSTPSLEQAFGIVQHAAALSQAGQRVVFHCKGGLGRAGTLCACTLVYLGMNATDAIKLTREHRKGAIENQTQEQFVAQFAQQYGQR